MPSPIRHHLTTPMARSASSRKVQSKQLVAVLIRIGSKQHYEVCESFQKGSSTSLPTMCGRGCGPSNSKRQTIDLWEL